MKKRSLVYRLCHPTLRIVFHSPAKGQPPLAIYDARDDKRRVQSAYSNRRMDRPQKELHKPARVASLKSYKDIQN